MARTSTAELQGVILRAAADLLQEAGPSAFTQRKVADRAGVSLQSVYNRFDSKHALLDELANDGFVRLTDRLLNEDGRPLSSVEGPLENIAEGLGRYRRFAVGNPNFYGLMFDAPIGGFSLSDRTLGTAFSSLDVLVQAVARAQELDAVVGGDPLELAQRVWAAAHGALRFELHDVGFVDDWPTHYRRTVDTMVRGLRP